MCGIIGIIAKHGGMPFYADNLFTHMMMMDSIRGPDSTGVFGVTTKGHVDHVKADTDGYVFARSPQYQSFKGRMKDYAIAVGHNRKATVGKVTAANAHPFQEKHIIMVHNGTLRSTQGMADTDVDSHAICHALADHDPVKALGMLDGAFALVWYDQKEKTLNLARNSERPLSLIQYDATWVISSEVGLPLWLQGRDNRHMAKGSEIIRVPEKKILVFRMNNLDKAPEEVAYEEYRKWTPPVVVAQPSGSGASAWRHHSGMRQPADNGSLLTQRSQTDGRVINITSKRPGNPLIKAGEMITFEFDDARKENNCEVLLGSPVFEGEKDENIIVRTVLRPNEDYTKYFGSSADPKLWKGKIQHVRTMAGMLTIYVTNPEPHDQIMDAQGEGNEKTEVEAALKQGCARCKGPVTMKDVPISIVRKKKDGWRIVCPKCLSSSIEAAKSKNPDITLRVRQQ